MKIVNFGKGRTYGLVYDCTNESWGINWHLLNEPETENKKKCEHEDYVI